MDSTGRWLLLKGREINFFCVFIEDLLTLNTGYDTITSDSGTSFYGD